MAKVVRYFEDFQTEERRKKAYSEGPFVLMNAHAYGWIIEVESNTAPYPIIPNTSIYKLRKRIGLNFEKTNSFKLASRVCDTLNEMVKSGEIMMNKHGEWVAT